MRTWTTKRRDREGIDGAIGSARDIDPDVAGRPDRLVQWTLIGSPSPHRNRYARAVGASDLADRDHHWIEVALTSNPIGAGNHLGVMVSEFESPPRICFVVPTQSGVNRRSLLCSGRRALDGHSPCRLVLLTRQSFLVVCRAAPCGSTCRGAAWLDRRVLAYLSEVPRRIADGNRHIGIERGSAKRDCRGRRARKAGAARRQDDLTILDVDAILPSGVLVVSELRLRVERDRDSIRRNPTLHVREGKPIDIEKTPVSQIPSEYDEVRRVTTVGAIGVTVSGLLVGGSITKL